MTEKVTDIHLALLAFIPWNLSWTSQDPLRCGMVLASLGQAAPHLVDQAPKSCSIRLEHVTQFLPVVFQMIKSLFWEARCAGLGSKTLPFRQKAQAAILPFQQVPMHSKEGC